MTWCTERFYSRWGKRQHGGRSGRPRSASSHPGDRPKQVDELRGREDLRAKLRRLGELTHKRDAESSEEVGKFLAPMQERLLNKSHEWRDFGILQSAWTSEKPQQGRADPRTREKHVRRKLEQPLDVEERLGHDRQGAVVPVPGWSGKTSCELPLEQQEGLPDAIASNKLKNNLGGPKIREIPHEHQGFALVSQSTPVCLQGILVPQFNARPERVIGQKSLMHLAKTFVNFVRDHAFATLGKNPGQSKRPGTYLNEHHVLI